MIEWNSFICGDCMEYLPQFPDKYFDIAVVDPPYGIGEHGGKCRSGYVRQKNGTKLFVKDGGYIKEDWDNHPPSRKYFDELIRVSKNQIIWGVNYFDYVLPGGRIVWDKCNDGADQSNAEIAYCSMNNRIDIFRYMWRGMMQGKSIEEGTVQQGNKHLNEKRIHPTQKPVNLYRWIIKRYFKPGWVVLDTHTGSASSLIAYEESGIPYIAFENNERIFDLASKRLSDFKQQITLFDCGMERK